jgi:hypothetical protein
MVPLILMATVALAHQTQSFTIYLNGATTEVAALFGPVREAEWAPSWAPHFVNPKTGAQREGVVFTTRDSKGKESSWILTEYDTKEGRVSYAFITPGFSATALRIRIRADGPGRSKVLVTYSVAALAPEANDQVNQHDTGWAQQQRHHWENAINAVLAKGGGS